MNGYRNTRNTLHEVKSGDTSTVIISCLTWLIITGFKVWLWTLVLAILAAPLDLSTKQRLGIAIALVILV